MLDYIVEIRQGNMKSVYQCTGKHHREGNCWHKCISIVPNDIYLPINCLIYTEGYGLTVPKWTKVGETQ